jgi:hypothetical protein
MFLGELLSLGEYFVCSIGIVGQALYLDCF